MQLYCATASKLYLARPIELAIVYKFRIFLLFRHLATYIWLYIIFIEVDAMKDDISARIIAEAEYILESKATVRDTAQVFGVSKSTVHKDVSERLQDIDRTLCEEVKKILEYNKAERHIRGGSATKQKYGK